MKRFLPIIKVKIFSIVLSLTFHSTTFYSNTIQVQGTCPEDILMQEAPQFQIVAAAKTGSTSLYSYLCENPYIECLAKKKELNLLRDGRMKTQTDKVKVFFPTFCFYIVVVVRKKLRHYNYTFRRVSI